MTEEKSDKEYHNVRIQVTRESENGYKLETQGHLVENPDEVELNEYPTTNIRRLGSYITGDFIDKIKSYSKSEKSSENPESVRKFQVQHLEDLIQKTLHSFASFFPIGTKVKISIKRPKK